MEVKKICAVLLIAVLVWGCAKVEINSTTATGPEAIRMKPAVSMLQPVSRAPFTNDLSSEVLTARVPATLTSGNYTTTYADGSMTFSGSTPVSYNTVDFEGNGNLPDNEDTRLFLRGFYPSAAWTKSDNQFKAMFSGCEDIMTTGEVFTTKRKVRENDFATLVFQHQLTFLEIVVQTADAEAVAKWKEILGITVSKTTGQIETSLAIDLLTGAYTFGDPQHSLSTFALSTGGAYTDNSYAGTTLVAGTSELTAYILAPPLLAIDPKKYTFNVRTLKDGTPTDSVIDVELNDANGTPFTASTAGYSFVVTFNFRNNGISAQATVKGWQTGGTSVVQV